MSKKHHKSNDFKVEEQLDQAVQDIQFNEDTVEVVEPPSEPAYGIVFDCENLNIRKAPNIEAEVVCRVAVGTELMIDESESTDEWYRVYTNAGLDGYSMKKFITLKQ